MRADTEVLMETMLSDIAEMRAIEHKLCGTSYEEIDKFIAEKGNEAIKKYENMDIEHLIAHMLKRVTM